jgi:hypothetical protein
MPIPIPRTAPRGDTGSAASHARALQLSLDFGATPKGIESGTGTGTGTGSEGAPPHANAPVTLHCSACGSATRGTERSGHRTMAMR